MSTEVLSQELVEAIDNALTDAALIVQSAYKHGAEIVHVAFESDGITLLITPSPKFDLRAIETEYPGYRYLLTGDKELNTNGTTPCCAVTLPFAYSPPLAP